MTSKKLRRPERYHLCKHIYVTQFRNEVIMLDTLRDEYVICTPRFTALLLRLISVDFEMYKSASRGPSSFGLQSLQDMSDIQTLIDGNILEKKGSFYPYTIDQKIDSVGVSNVDWRLPLENKTVRLDSSVLKAFMTLLKVNFYIKVRGFYPTIQLIKKSRKIQTNYIIPQEKDLRALANIVNKACLIYPTRTKCLEWAITFVLLALKRAWQCNLEIGVQNYPFLAHAWVECDKKVVMDSQDLREGLAIILNEPFRRLKI